MVDLPRKVGFGVVGETVVWETVADNIHKRPLAINESNYRSKPSVAGFGPQGRFATLQKPSPLDFVGKFVPPPDLAMGKAVAPARTIPLDLVAIANLAPAPDFCKAFSPPRAAPLDLAALADFGKAFTAATPYAAPRESGKVAGSPKPPALDLNGKVVPPPLDLAGYPGLSPKCVSRDESVPRTLRPSVAPTPRTRSNSRPILFGSYLVRPAQILLPSANAANDFARVRNGGKPLQTRPQLAERGQGLLHVASAPALLSGGSSPSSAAAPGEVGLLGPKTPRSTRGMVRKVSKVLLSVPIADRLRLLPPEPSSPPNNKFNNASSPTVTGRLQKSPSNKKVSFLQHTPRPGDMASSRYALPAEGAPSLALKKSMKLLDSLHDLRRVNVEDSPSHTTVIAPDMVGETLPGSFASDEKAAALLHTTLGELYDTEASVRALEVQLGEANRAVTELGGSRFATAVISSRTLAVVRRKASLLQAVEARIVAFEAAHAKREELVPQILRGDHEEPPADLVGIHKFISEFVHKSPSGSPVDADKSHFESFAKNFKLPVRHYQLERLRGLSLQISQWWAETSLRVAEEGSTYEQIRRMFAVTLGAGADSDHPLIFRATKILNDRLADKVLKDAQDRQKRDTEAAERSEVAQVGPASRHADLIEQALLEVIGEGVPESDPRLTQAKDICKALREADGQRKRLVARQKRLAGEGR